MGRGAPPRIPIVSEMYLLGIDNGGTVAKAAIFAPDGRELAVAAHKTETLAPVAGLGRVRRGSAVAGNCCGRAPCDREGRHLRGQDRGRRLHRPRQRRVSGRCCRASCAQRDLFGRHAGPRVRRALDCRGDRPRGAARRPCRHCGPANPTRCWHGWPITSRSIVGRTRWCLMCKDYTRMRLTGEAFAEQTDMSGTSLMDVGAGQYDAGLLDAFGIRAWGEKLPPLRLSSDVCGRVTPAAAAATGLAPGTPVAGGLFDIDACALSSAILDENQLAMTFGTWGINQYVSRTPVVDNIFMTSRYCVPDYFLMLEGSATSAGNLEWFLAQFFRDEARRRRMPAAICMHRSTRGCEQTAADRGGFAVPAVSVRVERRGGRDGLPGRALRAPRPPAHRSRRLRRGRLWSPPAPRAAVGVPRDARDDSRQRRGCAERRLDADGGRRVSMSGRSARRERTGRLGSGDVCGRGRRGPRGLSGGVRRDDSMFPALSCPRRIAPRFMPPSTNDSRDCSAPSHPPGPISPGTGVSRCMKPATFLAACVLSAGGNTAVGLAGWRDARVALEPRAAVLRVMGCRVDSGSAASARRVKNQLCMREQRQLSPAGCQYLASLAALQQGQASSLPGCRRWPDEVRQFSPNRPAVWGRSCSSRGIR